MKIITRIRGGAAIEDRLPPLEKMAADELSRQIARFTDRPILLLLSGGSSFRILKHIDAAHLSPSMTIGMFDERWTLDPRANNYSQLLATGFPGKAIAHGSQMIDSHARKGESFAAYGERLEKNLRAWVAEHPHGKVLATFGIGTDGHTGGILPYPENPALFRKLFEGERWVAAYDAGSRNGYPLRATCTMTFIRNFIDERIVYAAGEGKRPALQRMLAKQGSLPETPARIHRDADGAVIFTDLES